jgi:hypothetical protein
MADTKKRKANNFVGLEDAFEHNTHIQAKILSEKEDIQDPLYASSLQVEKDLIRQKFIDKQIPEYFGVRTLVQQKSVIQGRHPVSLKKDSELWHYTKQSNERQQRIKKGHGFWDVINESSDKNIAAMELDAKDKKTLKTQDQIIKKVIQHIDNTNAKEQQQQQQQQQQLLQKKLISAEKHQQANASNTANTATNTTAVHVNVTSSSATNSNSNKGSIQAQLKNAMAKSSTDLNLRVDFQARSIINYNMCFLIMNYNEEVFYFDKSLQEFHIKPLKELKAHDRAKFRMIDLENPSNPKAIKFGDDVWFQVLPVDTEAHHHHHGYNSNMSNSNNTNNTQEDTWQHGFCLTAQIYDPVEVKEVPFDAEFLAASLLHSTKTQHEQHQKTMKKFLDPSKVSKEEKAKKTIKEINKLQKRLTLQEMKLKGLTEAELEELEKENPDSILATTTTTATSGRKSEKNLEKENPNLHPIPTSIQQEEEDDAADEGMTGQGSTTSLLTTTEGGDTSRRPDTAEAVVRKLNHQEQYANLLKVCGQIHTSRIVDPEKLATVPEGITMTKDKLVRYVQRSTMHLGKWTLSSAVHMEDSHSLQEHFLKHMNTKGGEDTTSAMEEEENQNNSGNSGLKDLIHSHLISATPIIIQQDQYCLSSASPEEYNLWPPNSTYIVNHSSSIPHELAQEYDEEYNEFLKTNANHIDLLQLPSIYGKVPQAESLKLKQLTTQAGKKGPHKNKKDHSSSNTAQQQTTTSPVSGAQSSINPRGGNTTTKNTLQATTNTKKQSQQQSQQQISSPQHQTDFICLRRLIPRPVAYGFSVDRRSVWKFCLFEEFASSGATQSKNENTVKKIMDTANMVLKLSRMNREGAKIHIRENHIEKLPPLTSGEKFIPHLREIKLRNAYKKSFKSLEERRINELEAQEYFQERFQDVLEGEKTNFRTTLTKVRSNRPLFKSASSQSLEKIHQRILSREIYQEIADQQSLEGEGNHEKYVNPFSPSGNSTIKTELSDDDEDDQDDNSTIHTEVSGLSKTRVSFSNLPSAISKHQKYRETESPPADHNDLFTYTSLDTKYYSMNSKDSGLKEKKKFTSHLNHNTTNMMKKTMNIPLEVSIGSSNDEYDGGNTFSIGSSSVITNNNRTNKSKQKKNKKYGAYEEESDHRSHHSHKTPYKIVKKKLARRFTQVVPLTHNNSYNGNAQSQSSTLFKSMTSPSLHSKGAPIVLSLPSSSALEVHQDGGGGDGDDVSVLSMGSLGSDGSLNSSMAGGAGSTFSRPTSNGGGAAGTWNNMAIPAFSPEDKNGYNRRQSQAQPAYTHITRNHFSEDVKRVFNTNIVHPQDKHLLLLNNQAVSEFPTFSIGEQLVSYHKTMSHIAKVAKVIRIDCSFIFES